MIERNPLPPQNELQALIHYNPETGKLFWKPRGNSRFDNKYAGKEAFTSLLEGYYVGGLLSRSSVKAHRVAYKYVHGVEPDEVDHINGDRSDNRICNLRDVTSAENKRNASMPSTNTSGVVGVSFDKSRNKWLATITLSNRAKNLGRFDNKNDAITARKNAEILNGFHVNHGRASA